MKLRKSNRLIRIAGVAVIIVAAIVILLFQVSEGSVTETPEENELRTYDAKWTVIQVRLPPILDDAKKNSPFETTISIPQGNLRYIRFSLTWIDKAFLNRIGLDTLILETTTPDGEVIKESITSAKRTRRGNIEQTLLVNELTVPSSEPIVAKDIFDAREKLKKPPYYIDKWENEEFKIKVSVTGGERFLWRIRDRGNFFTLKIKYDYYHADLIE